MADIEVVIKIPEEMYKNIQSGNFWLDSGLTLSNAYDFIKNGTPLPKGHGALKDADKIIADGISKGFCDWYDEIKYADTIIEVDKAESEK